MRILLCCSLCVSILFFSGCASQGNEPACSPPCTPREIPVVSSEEFKGNDMFLSNNADVEADTPPAEGVWKQYAKLYHTDFVFTDLYMKEKYLLIGDENIVQLISIAGYDDVVVLNRASVERVEYTTFDSFASIEIFDKTNQSAAIMTTPEEATVILELLQ